MNGGSKDGFKRRKREMLYLREELTHKKSAITTYFYNKRVQLRRPRHGILSGANS